MREYALEWTGAAPAGEGAPRRRRGIFRRRGGWKAGDALLVQLARFGDELAFDCLWARHAPAAHAVLSALVPPAEAEDLLQETALRAWQQIRTLREGGRFAAWACQIARHLGRDWRRARSARPQVALEDVPEPAQPPHADAANGKLEADEVLAAVRTLPACYAEPLLLRLLLGMTNAEISERTGLTPGSVRVNLHRGMRRLRRALGPEFAP